VATVKQNQTACKAGFFNKTAKNETDYYLFLTHPAFSIS
jgi:hypothetical protein